MSTYRHGSWIQPFDDLEYYSIDKKTFFGWKEIVWWYKTPSGHEKMMRAVESLEKQGHLVL